MIKFPTTLFFKDYNIDIENNIKYNKKFKGTWCTVYWLDNNKVLKQISSPGIISYIIIIHIYNIINA